jgi:hypothetical protein
MNNSPKAFTYDDDPAFCIIAPTAYLEHYAIQSRKHLVLAHLVDVNKEYANYYLKRSQAGDGIIMDNGAFELGESYAPEKLLDLGKECGADVLVLPDYPFKPAQITIDAADQYAPMFKDAGFKTMFVPQSEVGAFSDFVDGYMWAADNDLIDVIGMSILNIPNAMPHLPPAYARVVMTEILMDRGVFASKYHHYLGLNAGPALEIPALIDLGALNSCDSSNPVWVGILGHEYSRNTDSYLSVKKVKAHVEFDYKWVKDKDTHRRIQHNLDLTLELFAQ